MDVTTLDLQMGSRDIIGVLFLSHAKIKNILLFSASTLNLSCCFCFTRLCDIFFIYYIVGVKMAKPAILRFMKIKRKLLLLK